MAHLDRADKIVPMLSADSIDKTEPADPIDKIEPADPTESIEPADPIDKIEPTEPIDKIEPDDPIDSTDRADPIESTELPTDPMAAFSQRCPADTSIGRWRRDADRTKVVRLPVTELWPVSAGYWHCSLTARLR
jgi:hypothetical protein